MGPDPPPGELMLDTAAALSAQLSSLSRSLHFSQSSLICNKLPALKPAIKGKGRETEWAAELHRHCVLEKEAHSIPNSLPGDFLPSYHWPQSQPG